FFVAGDGTLDIASKPLGEHVTVRYRRDDGTYDYEAMERIRHILRCRGDGYEAEITPRFVELLGYMNVRSGRPLALLSGSRRPLQHGGAPPARPPGPPPPAPPGGHPRRPRLPPRPARAALARYSRPRVLRGRLLPQGGIPARRRRQAALLGAVHLAGRRE